MALRVDPGAWARQKQEKLQKAAKLREERGRADPDENHTFKPQLSRKGSASVSRFAPEPRDGPAARQGSYNLDDAALMRNAYPPGGSGGRDSLDEQLNVAQRSSNNGSGYGSNSQQRQRQQQQVFTSDRGYDEFGEEDALGGELQRRHDVHGARRGSDLAREAGGGRSSWQGTPEEDGFPAESRSGVKPVRRRGRPEWNADNTAGAGQGNGANVNNSPEASSQRRSAPNGNQRALQHQEHQRQSANGRRRTSIDTRADNAGGGGGNNADALGFRGSNDSASISPRDRAEMRRSLSALKEKMRRDATASSPRRTPLPRAANTVGPATASAAGGRYASNGHGTNKPADWDDDQYLRALGGRTAPASFNGAGSGSAAQNNGGRARRGSGIARGGTVGSQSSAWADADEEIRAPPARAGEKAGNGRSSGGGGSSTDRLAAAAAPSARGVDSGPPEEAVEIELEQCGDCGRRFRPDVLLKHFNVCKKVFLEKRKSFDAGKQRIKGTELAQFAKQQQQNRKPKRSGGMGGTGGVPAPPRQSEVASRAEDAPIRRGGGGGGSKAGGKWREQSNAFREAMRQARMVSQAQKSGKSLADLPSYAPSAPDPSLVLCDNCGRRFNAMAAERHIPKCREIRAKPSVLKKGSGTLLGATARAAAAASGGGRRKPAGR